MSYPIGVTRGPGGGPLVRGNVIEIPVGFDPRVLATTPRNAARGTVAMERGGRGKSYFKLGDTTAFVSGWVLDDDLYQLGVDTTALQGLAQSSANLLLLAGLSGRLLELGATDDVTNAVSRESRYRALAVGMLGGVASDYDHAFEDFEPGDFEYLATPAAWVPRVRGIYTDVSASWRTGIAGASNIRHPGYAAVHPGFIIDRDWPTTEGVTARPFLMGIKLAMGALVGGVGMVNIGNTMGSVGCGYYASDTGTVDRFTWWSGTRAWWVGSGADWTIRDFKVAVPVVTGVPVSCFVRSFGDGMISGACVAGDGIPEESDWTDPVAFAAASAGGGLAMALGPWSIGEVDWFGLWRKGRNL